MNSKVPDIEKLTGKHFLSGISAEKIIFVVFAIIECPARKIALKST